MKREETLEEFLLRSSDVLFPDQARMPKPLTVHSRASDGDTPLHVAAFWGDRHATRILLEAGADVNAKGDMSCTPLYFAVMKNHVQVAEFLLERGADPDAKSELDSSPRTLAPHKGDEAMMALLRRHW
jgi:uncharacterized protein